MRRADRLFQIIQILRRASRPVTAARLGEELEVSRRTVYRDMRDLIGQRVPIDGEAGLGYVLAAGYDMPPLMLSPDELDAVVLGAQWVANHGDRTLAAAARDLVAKIAAVVPDALRPCILEPGVGVEPTGDALEGAIEVARLRLAIRSDRKLRLRYRSQTGQLTDRTVIPVILGYAETSRLLIGWCELRQDFRHFRLDRIVAFEVLERSGLRRGAMRRQWERWREQQMGQPPDQRGLAPRSDPGGARACTDRRLS